VLTPSLETILISQEQHTHFLDLHKYSIEYITKIGPDAAHRLNRSPDDFTREYTRGIAFLISSSHIW
jgi:hypothetical protein